MPVAKSAVDDFFKRKLKNSDKARDLAEEELAGWIDALPVPPRFELKPYRHQLVCFLLGVKRASYFFMLDMGLGKSAITINIFRWLQDNDEAKRMLVLVPNISNIEAWDEELGIHAPELTSSLFDQGTRKVKEKMILEGGQVAVVTYMGWLRLISKTVNGKLKIDPKQASLLEKNFDMVVFDESTALKNHRSLTFKACRRLIKTTPFRYCLTGTPFDKDPQDLWSQFFVLDSGETLGPTLGLYRAAFFKEKDDYWSGGKTYTFDKKLDKELNRVIKHSSIRYTEEECLDLPESIGGLLSPAGPMSRQVLFDPETLQYYYSLIDEVRESEGNLKVLANVYTRMRQLTAGFLPVKDDEERFDIIFDKNPKLDALMDLIKEIPPDCKIVVYNEFKMSGELICARLKKEKFKHARVYSGTKDKKAVLTQFKQDPKTRVLVGSRSIAFGLNLQIANYIIFFESPDSTIIRKQVERRIRRSGQTKRTHFYDLVIKGSVDEKILRFMIQGKDLFDALVEGEFHHLD